MLSPYDAEVVRRDRAIPGLATLLDAEAFAARLRQQAPQAEIGGVRPFYVRYKPGMNCLVAYKVQLPGGQIDIYAKAHGAGAADPLREAVEQPGIPGPLGPGRLAMKDLGIVVSVFPNDSKLEQLGRLGLPEEKTRLFRRVFSDRPDLWEAEIRSIRYKPERRMVAQLLVEGAPQAVLKFYTGTGYPEAKQSARVFNRRKAGCQVLQVPRRLGHSDRHHLLAFEWMEGQLLSEALAGDGLDLRDIERVGVALAEGHRRPSNKLAPLNRVAEASTLLSAAAGLAFLVPHLSEKLHGLARRLATYLMQQPAMYGSVHGDFYAKQVLLAGDRVVILDFDSAAAGDPAYDLGLFVAHLERGAIRHTVHEGRISAVADALLKGYEQESGQAFRERVRVYAAAGLLKLAPHQFRNREQNWPQGMEAIIDRAEAVLNSVLAPVRSSLPSSHTRDEAVVPTSGAAQATSIAVSDPFGVANDPAMPFLAQALNPDDVLQQFRRQLSGLTGGDGQLDLLGIRAVRHKTGRRCLIEYDVAVERPGEPPQVMTLVGKARARGLDKVTYETVSALWRSGFGGEAEDGISVPEPVGAVPKFQMWLHRKVPGVPATKLLASERGADIAGRIAEAAHKLHRAWVRAPKQHTMSDELRILHERLPLVAEIRPEWVGRIQRLLEACDRVGATLPKPRPTGIHRDFYADQVLVDGERLYLLDFDLYCQGDPGLDIGNFLGHVEEQALRSMGDSDALSTVEEALEERFVELSGEQVRRSIQVYAALTLVRHIHISTRFPDRQHITEALLELSEQRLASLAPLSHTRVELPAQLVLQEGSV
ncbi:MAG TPA: phosphotransferase [Chloroflexia bacterium]